MLDQAHGLRALASQNRDERKAATGPSLTEKSPETFAQAVVTPPAQVRRARVIAVTSGKGGVGKTNFSSNLSLALAETGNRVIVVDADLGLANLHVVLGIYPQYNLEHVTHGDRSLREVLCPGPNGIRIVAGASGLAELADLDAIRREALIESLGELDTLADVVLIDTGAGLARNVLAFLCAAGEVLVVTTPEPTALTDAYAIIKTVYHENPQSRLMLAVNMAQNEAEARSAQERVVSIARRFLGTEVVSLGSIPHDPAVGQAVRNGKPFLLSYPSSPAARAVRKIAHQLTYSAPAPAEVEGVGGLLSRMQRFFNRHLGGR
ncbi:ATPase involved in chromosome partitioning [Chthonomonas calidirosea]|uniref:MinD/ParA family protein n=1 Tax=Chthonomonas calidirosea TaxID=454171 RepID=UPI0006DD53CE|nr:MinD/ParA family protein [Chthonomonas calidirosea]CEK12712.1 ATPase involved in chromosome partitioning [Chthonomonas calidirosea]